MEFSTSGGGGYPPSVKIINFLEKNMEGKKTLTLYNGLKHENKTNKINLPTILQMI